ncbi:hypothetical protein A2765_04660 [Candidatus Kaiserbacteria bacterium RIFCSPHIGHO2_01_FULL_56_24]|uniref:Uncharacterized protein n=1 Tax=Candidatus Kaiserbacteria bacterium RIFCSPHIGHO2_01_FULL_56_24 TaxID=1798487 RepID=A0A1F6DEI9_9BACT|nr:MAG: hypothetical protein A2765_04660 [Candidatus Kaiserbacteria bacterium RIFCSPHIGHO2_01_FULL_56_24]
MLRIILASVCAVTLTSASVAFAKPSEEVSLFDQQIVGPTHSEAEVDLCEWSEMGGLRLPEIGKQTFCEPQSDVPTHSSDKDTHPTGGD